MVSWCITHYWMTFFIVLAVIDGAVEIAKAFSHIKDKDDDEE